MKNKIRLRQSGTKTTAIPYKDYGNTAEMVLQVVAIKEIGTQKCVYIYIQIYIRERGFLRNPLPLLKKIKRSEDHEYR